MKDGSRVVIKIAYKPKSVMNSKGEKCGSYYFIAKHFFHTGKNTEVGPKRVLNEPRRRVPVKKEHTGKNTEAVPKPTLLLLEREYAKPSYRRKARIYISFYDREGYLLLGGFNPDG